MLAVLFGGTIFTLTLATLARWCGLRSYLDPAAALGITALDAITRNPGSRHWRTRLTSARGLPRMGTLDPSGCRSLLATAFTRSVARRARAAGVEA